MAKLITQCPSCSSSQVFIDHVHCSECSTQFKGQFEIPALLRLAPEDIQFIVQFVKNSGSLKEMAKDLGLSYPTVRNKLNEIIDSIQAIEKNKTTDKTKILRDLELGKISAQEAAKKLAEI
ncbi:MAG: DUF2089 domain-containing protein [Bdellovibrionaceae bacterium]|nr:DUF2089 domain-containing protein [Pseudobdellovibrionaceae bacterium]